MDAESGPLRLEVAAPCSADWAQMDGDARKRFCALCQKHVYDLSGMTRAEIRALLQRPEGTPCVRFFQREDGTVLTVDCPVGLRERAWRLAWRARAAWAAAVVAVLAVLGLGELLDREPTFELQPIARTAPVNAPQAVSDIPRLPEHARRGPGVRTTVQTLITGERGTRMGRISTIGLIVVRGKTPP